MSLLSIGARAFNTRPGRRLRRSIDRFLARHPVKWRAGDTTIALDCITDWLSRNGPATGMGYHPWCVLTPVERILDLGCNTGLFTLWVNEKQNWSLDGVAIDANEKMVRKCRRNFDLNNVRVKTLWAMVGEEQGQTFLTHRVHVSSSAVRMPMAWGEYDGEITTPHCVEVDDVWGWWQTEPPDLAKIDIEGSEFGLLKSYGKMIHAARKIVIEWHEPLCDLSYVRSMLPCHRLVAYDYTGWTGVAYMELKWK